MDGLGTFNTDSQGHRFGKLIVFKIEIHGIRDIEANKINWTSDLGSDCL